MLFSLTIFMSITCMGASIAYFVYAIAQLKRKIRERSRKTLAEIGPQRVRGHVQEGFHKVRECLLNLFAEGRETGVFLCIYYKGRCVVDLVGGWKRRPGSSLSNGETLCHNDLCVVFSNTKTISSLVVAMLEDRGLLTYKDKISNHWPKFADGDQRKKNICVADLMKHQAALATTGSTDSLNIDFFTADKVNNIGRATLEKIPLNWDLNSNIQPKQFYHAHTRDLFTSVICSQVDPKGRGIPQFVKEEICGRLGDGVEFIIGKESAKDIREIHGRIATMYEHESIASVILMILLQTILPTWLAIWIYGNVNDSLLHSWERVAIFKIAFGRIFTSSSYGFLYRSLTAIGVPFCEYKANELANCIEYREACLPSSNGITNARSLAKIGAVLANYDSDGNVLLSKEALLRAEITSGPLMDECMGKRVSYTNCGWCLDRYSAAGCPGWIGWGGMGGSVFVWNHELNASFAYIPTQMNARAHKSRGVRLMKAFQDCIA